MNPNNHGSLEACQRLAKAGIVLETDLFWVVYSDDMLQSLRDAGKMIPQPYLADRKSFNGPSKYVIPAPSMAEAWRELPETINDDRTRYRISVWMVRGMLGCTYVSQYGKFLRDPINDENPTDALIDLLIWVTEQKRKEK